jgi:hypothetical protein
MVEFTNYHKQKISVASDAVAAISPARNLAWNTTIYMKNWPESEGFYVMEKYEEVREILRSDDWERSNGRC